LFALCPQTAGASTGKDIASTRAKSTAQTTGAGSWRCGMSAAAAMPCIVATANAVAEQNLRAARPRPIVGFAFYRQHCLALLQRYLQLSMELGRTPSVLGKIVLRGRVSSYRLRTFEDSLIFVLDVEKCINQLDPASRAVVAHIALEDYANDEVAAITGESLRSVGRIYAEAMNRLTVLFLQFGLLDPNVENLSRGEAKIQSNDLT
jgi:hypothetical protein